MAVYKANRMAIAYSNFNFENIQQVFTFGSIPNCSNKAIKHEEVAELADAG